MTAPTAPVMGFMGNLYYNSGTHGSPTWVAIGNVGDIKVTDERKESDIDVRNQGGFTVTVAGLRKATFEFSMVYDQNDAAQTALRTAYSANPSTPTEFLVLDGPNGTTGSSGLRALMIVSKFARQEEINNAMMVDVAIRPTYSANAPVAYTAP
jgi:hypothetical protein